jgi:hypothetical protein
MNVCLRLLTLPLLALLPAAFMSAQTPVVSTSTVYGRVLCADTNGPARFGRVYLKSTQGGGMGDDITHRIQAMAAKGQGHAAPKPLTDEHKRAQAAATRNMNHASDLLQGTTIGLDGQYSFAHVKSGTYYVHVSFPGYIDPLEQFSDDDLASTDPAVHARVVARVPVVTVSGTDSAHVDLTIDRGASVSGRLLFDDGTPASGWMVTMVRPNDADELDETSAAMTQALMLGGSILAAKTDDRGDYRIAGMPRGEYAVRASLNATDTGVSATNMADSGTGINLVVYSGSAFRHADAKPFTVTAGENRTGVDLTVPSSKLHTIIGHVYAKADDHALSSGQVSLTSKDNDAIRFRATIRDDGSFHYEYLPPGTYTLKVDSAADVHTTGTSSLMGMTIPKQDTLRKYGEASTDVILRDTDVDSVRLTVAQTDWTPPAKKPGPDVDPGAALGGILGGLLSGDDK